MGTVNLTDVLNSEDKPTVEDIAKGLIADDLDTDDSEKMLSAKQGKALQDTKLDAVTAGANITVNVSDPTNPIISAIPTTSAGILNRLYATGDTVTLSSGTYYLVKENDKGTVGVATQNIVVDDFETDYFAQDFITEASTEEQIYYAGTYSASATVVTSYGEASARFMVEVYLADVNGNAIDSGIASEPVGDLGVKPIVVMDSGILTLGSYDASYIALNTSLDANFTIATNQRIRFHVSGAKEDSIGSIVTLYLYAGYDVNTYVDIPVASTSDTVINKSNVTGATVSDALDELEDTKVTYSAGGTADNCLAADSWVTNYIDTSNVDHIWHDDSTDTWNFCSDTTFKAQGNSTLGCGGVDMNGGTLDNQSVRQIADASLSSGTYTFNYANGDMQQLTATGSITIAFSNFPSDVAGFIIDAVNWGSYTITHPAGMYFASGEAPEYTASGTDRLLVTKDKDDVYTLTVIAKDIKVVA